jgi:hypothetical protein
MLLFCYSASSLENGKQNKGKLPWSSVIKDLEATGTLFAIRLRKKERKEGEVWWNGWRWILQKGK